jgi:hypothetical protein
MSLFARLLAFQDMDITVQTVGSQSTGSGNLPDDDYPYVDNSSLVSVRRLLVFICSFLNVFITDSRKYALKFVCKRNVIISYCKISCLMSHCHVSYVILVKNSGLTGYHIAGRTQI